jgi:translation initiation factor IF-2
MVKEKTQTQTTPTTARTARPPVIVIVGHVDHGKTTLLDYIRKTNVAEREAGGITQATTAYEIIHNGRKLTFIDTPGHEAFGAMRARGAQAADLAVLVVSAEDGVKPQTKEALDILLQTKTPYVVAFTKIDKTGGNIDKARNDLSAAGVLFEGFGGQVGFHGVSGKTGEGVNDLLDLLLLTADMEELSYDPKAPASGFVLEARPDPKRGMEAILILKDGTLRRGDPLTTPSASGKVKILEDFAGKAVSELTPSAPAIVIGLEALPKVGEEFVTGENPCFQNVAQQSISKSGIRNPKSGAADLPLILKASDAGSLEALQVVLQSIEGAAEKGLHIVEAGVGDITDGDVKHAVATGATIVGFKTRVDKAAQNLAEGQSVKLIVSKIVYDLEKAVEDSLADLTSPVAAELEVLAVFNQAKLEKQLVGGRVVQGTFRAKAPFDILRPAGEEVPTAPLATGRVLTMHEKKSEIFQAEKGKEIGVVLNVSALIMVGDKLVIKK